MSLEIWNKFSKPPLSALKQIQAGRLKGKSDINPQWRYQAMTEVFGLCGVGWKYEIVRLWTEQGTDGQVFAFAQVNLYALIKEEKSTFWSEPIPAVGGSMLIQKERDGLYCNDEGFKMAVTDALGTAMKMIGVAAEVYLGNFDGSKYKDDDSNKVASTDAGASNYNKCYIALQEASNLEELKQAWLRVTTSQAYMALGGAEKESIKKVKDNRKEELGGTK